MSFFAPLYLVVGWEEGLCYNNKHIKLGFLPIKSMNFPTGLTFDDVLLKPRFSSVKRDEVNLSARLTKKLKLEIPVIASAMDTVSESSMAMALGQLGGLAVLHRNCTIAEEVSEVKKVKKQKLLVGAAVGPLDIERAIALDKARVDVLFIDCASAHNKRVIISAGKIKKNVKAQIAVGNIATQESALALVKFADAVKVGVGPGSICTTRVVTGVGVPQLTALLEVNKIAKKYKVPVIADGGIKYSGDIVKALAAGADTVMLGSMLAGTKEAPGKLVTINNQRFKSYRGMGSLGAMQGGQSSDRYFQKGKKRYVPEGIEGIIPYKGPVEEVIWHIVGGLKSGMGYIGAQSIGQIPKQARFIKITNASLKESHPHTVTINKKAPNY